MTTKRRSSFQMPGGFTSLIFARIKFNQ